MTTSGKSALVILGAGASHDLLATVPTRVREKFKPPLTQHLFGTSRLVLETLRHFPEARALASSVSVEIAQGRGLEEILADLSTDHSSPTTERFRELTLYLRELFWLVSENYTDQPINYEHLSTKLLHQTSGLSNVAFVTLNYDVILDRVLQGRFLGLADHKDGYISERCMLVKPHGSVDWVRRVDSVAPKDLLSIVDQAKAKHLHRKIISELDVDFRPVGDIIVHPEWNLWDSDHIYYPVLSVPLGNYNFVCPPPHTDALKEFLPGCKNLLSVGFSARDRDLLIFLAGQLPLLSTFCFVAFKGAEEAATRFRDEVPQAEGAANQLVIADEFSSFLRTGGLEAFIESCE